MTCARCGQEAADKVGLTLPDGEYGFCSPAHFVLFVRDRWMLGETA